MGKLKRFTRTVISPAAPQQDKTFILDKVGFLAKKKKLIFIVSLGIVILLNIYFRLFPINFPQLKIQAKEAVEKIYLQNITQDVYARFPQFNAPAKDKIIKSRFSEYKKQNKEAIKKQIQDLYLNLKDRFQDERGQTYIMELDCWHWARYVENVFRFGRPGDETIDDRQWDRLMLAPTGMYLNWETLLFYFSSYLYEFFNSFINKIPLFTFLFHLPLFFSTIFIVVLYLFAYRYGKHLGAIVSCLFIGLAPTFLHRSCAGWFDKDILNLLFPILVTWTYLISYRRTSLKGRLLWIFFSAFWIGLFCFTWTHWWFIFFIIIIYEVISSVYLLVARFYFKRDNLAIIKQHTIYLLSFLSFSLFWVVLFSGTRPLIVLYHFVTIALTLNKPLLTSIWPNVYYTVGELKMAVTPEIAEAMWGRPIFIISLLCLLTLLIQMFRRQVSDYSRRPCITIMAIWFISMFFASLRGVRFMVFLLVPLGISLGWAVNELYEYFKDKKYTLGIIFIGIAFIVFFSMSVKKARQAAGTLYPLVNDTWYNVLNIIKQKTPENTIINSWWDFGDWFKTIARRRVIFDGQSQDTPQAYWMARALLTNNEEEAIKILRMLNNGGNKAFEKIDKYVQNPLESVLLLESILLLSRPETQQTLLNYLPRPAAEEVTKILFSDPSSACFIVESTMLPKISAISYIGNWDFSKVYIAQNFDSKEKSNIMEYLNNLGRDSQQIQKFYQEVFLIKPQTLNEWLSHRLQFYSELVNGQEKEDGLIYFNNGFIYDPKQRIVQSNIGQIPRSLFVLIENNFTEIVYPNANAMVSILIVKEKENYKCILLDRELASSLLVRLYVFNGLGMKHFSHFIDVEEGSSYIRVFNIVW